MEKTTNRTTCAAANSNGKMKRRVIEGELRHDTVQDHIKYLANISQGLKATVDREIHWRDLFLESDGIATGLMNENNKMKRKLEEAKEEASENFMKYVKMRNKYNNFHEIFEAEKKEAGKSIDRLKEQIKFLIEHNDRLDGDKYVQKLEIRDLMEQLSNAKESRN